MTYTEATTSNHPVSVAEDMLTGAEEMATFTGNTLRRMNYLLEKRCVPAYKEGRIWRMRKSTYIRFVEQREAVALARLMGREKVAA
jgi:hypothetical protein